MRARARTTAAELGVRNAPPNKKKAASKRAIGSPGDEVDALAAEVLGNDDEWSSGPRPVRLAAGNAGVSPSKHTRGGRMGGGGSPPGAGGDDDEVSKFLVEEGLN